MLAGAKDLSPTSSDVQGVLYLARNQGLLAGRVSAIGSGIDRPTHYSGSVYSPLYDFSWLLMSGPTGVDNDGAVPVASAIPQGVFSESISPLAGFDHSSYLSVTPFGVQPTGQSVVLSELNRWLDAAAPVASLLVPSPIMLAIGETQTLNAATLDASGAILPNRVVQWQSSAQGVASIDPQSGAVHALSTGTTTITASSEGRTVTTTIQGKYDGLASAVCVHHRRESRAINGAE